MRVGRRRPVVEVELQAIGRVVAYRAVVDDVRSGLNGLTGESARGHQKQRQRLYGGQCAPRVHARRRGKDSLRSARPSGLRVNLRLRWPAKVLTESTVHSYHFVFPSGRLLRTRSANFFI